MFNHVTWLQANPNTTFYISASCSIPLAYFSILQSLCHLRIQHPPYNCLDPGQTKPSRSLKLYVQIGGVGVAIMIFGFVFMAPIENPLPLTVVRTAAFFYACKILDLAVMKAANPPTMVVERTKAKTTDLKSQQRLASNETTVDATTATQPQDQNHPDTQTERLPILIPTDPTKYILHSYHYAFLLLTQMRYHSFSTATRQPHRPSPSSPLKTHDKLRHYLPLLLIPPLTYLLPNRATKSLLLLLVIQFSLEGTHTLLHPTCPNPVFWQPFAATSLTEFWNTHWQACASSWLRSLVYEPTQALFAPLLGKKAARAVAVVNVFSLTGIWHGLAAAPAVEEEWAWTLGVRVWLWFVSLGVGCVIENVVFGRRPGGWIRWVITWVYFLAGAGVCWSTLENHDRTGYMAMMGNWVSGSS